MTLVSAQTDLLIPGERPSTSAPAARIYRALGAQAWDEALRIAEQNWRQLLTSGIPAIRALIDVVPPERLDADPRWRRMRAWLIAAPPARRPSPPASRSGALTAVLRLTAEARAARRNGELAQALESTRRARADFERIPVEQRGGMGTDLAHVLFTWGLTETLAGDLPAGLEDLTQAYSAARASGDPRMALLAASELAWLHTTEGRTSARDHWARSARSLLPVVGPQVPAPIALALADAGAAYDRLAFGDARAALAAHGDPGEHAADLAWGAALLASKDPDADPAASLAALEQLEQSAAPLPPARRSELTGARAAVLLHLGRGEAARQLLAELPSPCSRPSARCARPSTSSRATWITRCTTPRRRCMNWGGRGPWSRRGRSSPPCICGAATPRPRSRSGARSPWPTPTACPPR